VYKIWIKRVYFLIKRKGQKLSKEVKGDQINTREEPREHKLIDTEVRQE
jgi:hypothetical protein